MDKHVSMSDIPIASAGFYNLKSIDIAGAFRSKVFDIPPFTVTDDSREKGAVVPAVIFKSSKIRCPSPDPLVMIKLLVGFDFIGQSIFVSPEIMGAQNPGESTCPFFI